MDTPEWFNLAASLTTGEVADHSRLARDNLAEVMTDSQVYEAQRLAREWQPKTIGPETGPLDMNTLKKAIEWSLGRDGPAGGIVIIQAVIRKNGRADSFKVLSDHLGYGLEERAIQEIANNWRFRPGTLRGRPVDVMATIEVQFNLR